MAELFSLIDHLGDLPDRIKEIAANGISVQSDGCPADTSDCTKDGSTCTSDSSCTSDCSSDSSCSSDCSSDTPKTPPSFRVGSIDESSCRIYITNPSSYYIRVIVRPADSTTAVYDEWNGIVPSGESVPVRGLESGTDYVANVIYNTTGSGGGTAVGAQSFTTEGERKIPTYTTSAGTRNIVVNVSNPYNYYIRIYIRRSDSTASIIDEWVGNSSSIRKNYGGFEPNTYYTVNVAYGETEGVVIANVGAQQVKTQKETGGAYIRESSGSFASYTPYIRDKDSNWYPYDPVIMNT